MTYQHLRAGVVALMLALAGPALAGPVEKAKGAVDPDCDVGKAARGAATKAVVGVGNRCGVGETTRDTLGIDDREGNKKDDDGALKRVPQGLIARELSPGTPGQTRGSAGDRSAGRRPHRGRATGGTSGWRPISARSCLTATPRWPGPRRTWTSVRRHR